MKDLLTNLDHQGFHVWPNFLDDDHCNRLRNILERLPDEDVISNQAGDFHGSNTALIANILPQSSDFIELAQETRFLDAAEQYFRPTVFRDEPDPFQLHLMHARRVSQGAPAQELHIDSRLCGVSPPLILHMFIYLDDCLQEGSGATSVIPSSHLYNRYPSAADESDAIPLQCRKGTVVFLNSNLFHGSSAKQTSGDRYIITVAYSRWWIRQPFAIPYFRGWPRQLSEQEKSLFGFYNYADRNGSLRGLKSRGPLPSLVSEA